MMIETTVRRLVDNVPWVFATNQATMAVSRRLMAVSQRLMTETRDLMLTYRAHRFRIFRGGSESSNGDSTAVPRRGSLGGFARAARLTAEQRSEIARLAAQARWQRFRDGIGTGPPDARLGGLARAQRLTPEQRQQIARKAVEARLAARRGAIRSDPADEPSDPVDEPPRAGAS